MDVKITRDYYLFYQLYLLHYVATATEINSSQKIMHIYYRLPIRAAVIIRRLGKSALGDGEWNSPLLRLHLKQTSAIAATLIRPGASF